MNETVQIPTTIKAKVLYQVMFCQTFDICRGHDRAFLVIKDRENDIHSSMEIDTDISADSLAELFKIQFELMLARKNGPAK